MDQANELFAYFAWKAQKQRAIFEEAQDSARQSNRKRDSDRTRGSNRTTGRSTGWSSTPTPSIHQHK